MDSSLLTFLKQIVSFVQWWTQHFFLKYRSPYLVRISNCTDLVLRFITFNVYSAYLCEKEVKVASKSNAYSLVRLC